MGNQYKGNRSQDKTECQCCSNLDPNNKIRDPKAVKEWIKNIGNLTMAQSDDIVKYSCRMAHFLTNNRLKTSQLRKFLDVVSGVKSLVKKKGVTDTEIKASLMLTIPPLAYAAGRQKTSVLPLFEVLEPAIIKVARGNDIKQNAPMLFKFVESIVAFHKLHGGQD